MSPAMGVVPRLGLKPYLELQQVVYIVQTVVGFRTLRQERRMQCQPQYSRGAC